MVIVHLKNLKIILQSKWFPILVLGLALLYTWFVTSNDIIFSKYREGKTKIIGTIVAIKKETDKTTIHLKAKETILVTVYEELSYQLGDQIEVEGTLIEPSTNRNFNLFSYRNYLRSEKIYYQMTDAKIKLIKKDHSFPYSMKGKITSYLESKNYASYLKLFLLGDNSAVEEEVLTSYRTNGVSHLFSISGMHITFLSSLLLMVLNRLSENTKRNYLIISMILLFYAFLTNFTPSVTRAILLFYLLTLKKFQNWQVTPFSLLLFLASFFLFYNPYYCYHMGFLYSFTVSGTLIYCSTYLSNIKGYFKKLLVLSLLAFLASIPISLYYNFELSFFTPFYNLLFVPFVTILLFPLSFFYLIFPFLSSLYGILIFLLEHVSLWFAQYPLLTVSFAKPSMLFLLFLIFVLLWNFQGIMHHCYKRLGVLAILLMLLYAKPYFRTDPVLTVLDVGQGDAILIELAHGRGNILIDTGGNVLKRGDYSYDISQNTLLPYLKSRGIHHLDYLILSHGDFDHMGEAIYLVNHFKVENVILNQDSFNDLEMELIQALKRKKIPYYQKIKELKIGNQQFYFLNTRIYDNENDNSNAIYTEMNNYRFLFMGDAGVEKEKDILEKYNLKNIDFLKVGHHGSNTSSSEYFISSMNPKYSLISVGKNNRYGHPKEEVLNTLSNSKIFRTDLDGSIEIKLNKNGYKIKTCSP